MTLGITPLALEGCVLQRNEGWGESEGIFSSLNNIANLKSSFKDKKERPFMTESLKRNSKALTEGPDRAPARAMLRAVGLVDEDFNKPLIAVANTWSEVTPCKARWPGRPEPWPSHAAAGCLIRIRITRAIRMT